MIGPSLSSLAQQTQREVKDMGILLLLLPLGFLTGIHGFRLASGYKIGHWLVCLAVLSYIIFIPILPLIKSFPLLLVLFLCLAVCQGFWDFLSNMMILRLYKKRASPYMNALHFIFGVGAILSPAILGLSIEYFGQIFLAYLLFSLLAIPALIILFFVRIPPVKSEENSASQRKRKPYILPLIHLFFLCYLVMEVGYSTWIYPYIEQGELLNAAAAGLFTSAFWFVFTLFRLIGTLLSLRVHPVKIMLGHAFVCLIATILMVLFKNNLWVLWFANIGLGAGLSVFFACMLAYCISYLHIPPQNINHFFTSATAGAMIGPWLMAQLFAVERAWIFYPLILAALITLFILFYLNRTRGEEV